ncbi:MAG TPA: DUF624 domain-containing protein [Thermomicrobiales bacterium]|nr:DUF624 domain-containing protein [Thermomicrobiales bacterium]
MLVFVKLIWRGFRDLFDQLLSFAFYSMLWWLCAILIVPGPPATVALFSMCDPRRKVSQPDFSDAVQVFKESFRRSWGIAIFSVPFLLILLWNLLFFSGTSQALVALVPLWIIMLVILYILMFYAFSVAATMESRTRNAFRGAMYVLVSRPFMSLGLSIFLMILGSVFAVMVLPMILFGPALLAAIVNRFVLMGLNVPIIDPDAPTDERQYERERGINPDRGFISRLRGGNNAKRKR